MSKELGGSAFSVDAILSFYYLSLSREETGGGYGFGRGGGRFLRALLECVSYGALSVLLACIILIFPSKSLGSISLAYFCLCCFVLYIGSSSTVGEFVSRHSFEQFRYFSVPEEVIVAAVYLIVVRTNIRKGLYLVALPSLALCLKSLEGGLFGALLLVATIAYSHVGAFFSMALLAGAHRLFNGVMLPYFVAIFRSGVAGYFLAALLVFVLLGIPSVSAFGNMLGAGVLKEIETHSAHFFYLLVAVVLLCWGLIKMVPIWKLGRKFPLSWTAGNGPVFMHSGSLVEYLMSILERGNSGVVYGLILKAHVRKDKVFQLLALLVPGFLFAMLFLLPGLGSFTFGPGASVREVVDVTGFLAMYGLISVRITRYSSEPGAVWVSEVFGLVKANELSAQRNIVRLAVGLPCILIYVVRGLTLGFSGWLPVLDVALFWLQMEVIVVLAQISIGGKVFSVGNSGTDAVGQIGAAFITGAAGITMSVVSNLGNSTFLVTAGIVLSHFLVWQLLLFRQRNKDMTLSREFWP